MVDAINNALSGLQAAAKRFEVSANNIANQYSTRTIVNGQVSNQPFIAQRVDQIALSGGGVRVLTKNVDPASVSLFDPTNPDADAQGLVQFPNVDTAAELVNQKIATYDYKANLTVIKKQDELEQSLLDILS